MLVSRLLTAAIGIPILIGAILSGPLVFTALVSGAVIIMSFEYAALTAKTGAQPLTPVLVVFAAAFPAISLYGGSAAATLWTILFIGVLMLMKVVNHRTAKVARLGTTAFGVFYIGLLPSMLTWSYSLDFGPLPVLMIFVAIWIADTSAYGIGRWFGRTPLIPALSPNKTVEGAIGSVLVTAVAIGLFSFWTDMSWLERAGFGAALALAGIFGDLFESAIKREADVKDSGSLLPGHGGFLDRVDSLLAAAPLGYFLLALWLG